MISYNRNKAKLMCQKLLDGALTIGPWGESRKTTQAAETTKTVASTSRKFLVLKKRTLALERAVSSTGHIANTTRSDFHLAPA